MIQNSSKEGFNKSVKYSLTRNNIVERTSEYITYRFPYSKNTFWTNFRLAHFGQNGMQKKTPSVEIIIITVDGTEYTTQSYNDSVPKWNTISNPIPSMEYDEDGIRMGVYFRVHLSEKEDIHNMPFHLIGFIDLFPSTPYYQYTYNHNIQYVFLQSNGNNNKYGVILTVLLDYHSYDGENYKRYSDTLIT